MRVFTEEEKTLLRRINEEKAWNLYTLIKPYIDGVSFTIDPENFTVVLVLERPENLSKRLNDIQAIIIQAVNLIKLFEDKGYIFTFLNSFFLHPTLPIRGIRAY